MESKKISSLMIISKLNVDNACIGQWNIFIFGMNTSTVQYLKKNT